MKSVSNIKELTIVLLLVYIYCYHYRYATDNKLQGSLWSFLFSKHNYVYNHCLSQNMLYIHESLQTNTSLECISFHKLAKHIFGIF